MASCTQQRWSLINMVACHNKIIAGMIASYNNIIANHNVCYNIVFIPERQHGKEL